MRVFKDASNRRPIGYGRQAQHVPPRGIS